MSRYKFDESGSVSPGFSPTKFPVLLQRFLRNPDVEGLQKTANSMSL